MKPNINVPVYGGIAMLALGAYIDSWPAFAIGTTMLGYALGRIGGYSEGGADERSEARREAAKRDSATH